MGVTPCSEADTAAVKMWQRPVRLVRRWPTLVVLLLFLAASLWGVAALSDSGWWLAAGFAVFLVVLLVEVLLPQRIEVFEREIVFRSGWSRRRLSWSGLVGVEARHAKWLGLDTVELVGLYADGARVDVSEFRLLPASRGEVWGGDEVAAVLTGLASNLHERNGDQAA